MAAVWARFNSLMLVLVFLALLAVIGMLATGVRGGPLDPLTSLAPTDSVKLPGTPISGPTTINDAGHYYLTRDVRVTGGVIAITINANEVSLDLGGFTVDGNDGVASWGIYLAGQRSDVTINNGTVRDFQFGLDAGDDSRVTIDRVNAASNVRGIQLGTRNVLTNCAVFENTETGVYVPESQGYSVIRDCVVVTNAGDGVAFSGFSNVLEGSRVAQNLKDVRAALPTGSNNAVRDNTIGVIRLETGGNRVLDNVCDTIESASNKINLIAAASSPHENFSCFVQQYTP